MRKRYSQSHANRGMLLERLVEMTNTQYRNGNVADIRKVPTPVKITSSEGQFVKGRKEKAEWVDFAGVYRGQAIAFDAKETKAKSFPLKNLSAHQYQLLQSWHAKGAITFLLISFKIESQNEPEVYRLHFEQLELAWEGQETGGAKSIPLRFFREQCKRVRTNKGYVLHYLEELKGGLW